MQASAYANRESAGRSREAKARNDRSSEQGSYQFADKRPEVVQMKGLQALFDKRHEQAAQRAENGSELPGKVVQRVEREGQVTWAITHLVREQDYGEGESLFGKDDDWRAAEVPPEDFGQLSYGQRIKVDDEAMFMSRRGANQENPVRRGEDKDIDELRHKWLRVLEVEVDGKFQPVGENVYVRAETIKLVGVEKPPAKKIAVLEHGPKEEEKVSGDLQEFEAAWQKVAAKRRRSVGRVKDDKIGKWVDDVYITSGSNWDKYDEGVNVAGDAKKPEERAPFEGVEQQFTLSANYDTGKEKEPVAYMVLEVRNDEGEPYMYIRWLIAHPERGGGGSKLVEEAIRRFKGCEKCTDLRVESAYSAVGWYEDQGFQVADADQTVKKPGAGYGDTLLVYK